MENDIKRIKSEIIKFFPSSIKALITDEMLEGVEEFRIRVNKPFIISYNDKEEVLSHIVMSEELLRCFEMICNNSVYAYQEEIANGFITIPGGHRVGICGKALYKGNAIYSLRDISSINIRVARQIIGVADSVISNINNNGDFLSTLIVSPPGLGKTTLLRDIIRQISNSGKNVGVVDERFEIASTYKGVAQNDLGIHTDVIDGIHKSEGILMLVRAMKPDFIATDEIGENSDIEAILTAVNAGVKIVATAHGKDETDLKRRTRLYELLDKGVFEKIIYIDKYRSYNVCNVGELYENNKI
ncbi:MAG: stage III sporulation protein AA [Clostridia bacterium]|nr:stage III sporulation protein AA [Clostridia bacterium]